MAKMSDEAYELMQEIKEKKVTARSARNTRTHCGKGGYVRMPSDNMSKKELRAMSGECVTYHLNKPMTWMMFTSMPDDLKIEYIETLRERFKVPDKEIAFMMEVDEDVLTECLLQLKLASGEKDFTYYEEWYGTEYHKRFTDWKLDIKYDSVPDYPIKYAEFKKLPLKIKIDYIKYIRDSFNAPDKMIATHVLGCCETTLSKFIRENGLGLGKSAGGAYRVWDMDGFMTWCNKDNNKVNEPINEPAVEIGISTVEEEPYDISKFSDNCSSKKEVAAFIPQTGEMKFEGSIDNILRTIGMILADNNVKLEVEWEVIG